MEWSSWKFLLIISTNNYCTPCHAEKNLFWKVAPATVEFRVQYLIIVYKALPGGVSKYRRFMPGPTLNDSKKKLIFFEKLSLNVVEIL